MDPEYREFLKWKRSRCSGFNREKQLRRKKRELEREIGEIDRQLGEGYLKPHPRKKYKDRFNYATEVFSSEDYFADIQSSDVEDQTDQKYRDTFLTKDGKHEFDEFLENYDTEDEMYEEEFQKKDKKKQSSSATSTGT